jgi:pimeloyl-ACP methyl ester carboxylesterase
MTDGHQAAYSAHATLAENLVQVAQQPDVHLFVAQTPGPADRALLVIHGGPDRDHTYLREPLTDLAGRHRVIFADLRGCGRSTQGLSLEQYTPDAVVADQLALLDALGVQRADVLGFSYGGMLAQRLALAAPHRVNRLIIASSSIPPVPPDAYDDWPEAAALRDRGPGVWADAPEPTPDLVRAAAVASADTDVWRPQARQGYLRRLQDVRFSAEWARPFLARTLPPARPEAALDRLRALGLPILLLHGRQDLTFPAKLAEQTAAALPAARAVILQDAGHMAHVDQPAAWLAALSEFLDA